MSTQVTWPDLRFGPVNLYVMPKLFMDEPDSNIHYEKLIYENMDKFYQLRLTVSEFRDKLYFNIRKYFLSYESEWIPSREGVSMEASMENTYALLDGIFDVLSQAEGEEIIKHYYARISNEQTG